MVAFFGLPGTRQFTLGWFPSRAEAQVWLKSLNEAFGETQESLNNLRQSEIMSDAKASKARWRSGQRIWDGQKVRPG